MLVDAIALVEGAPNPERAKQFYEFVTSDSALVSQAHTYYRIPVRQDLDSSRLPAWITEAEVEPMDLDWERLQEEGPTWMRYWDENIKGRGQEWLEERGLEF